MKVFWDNRLLADSEETVFIEGNHYFPPSSIQNKYFTDSELNTECFWKGKAHYYSLVDGSEHVTNAAWYYPEPKAGSEQKVGHTFKNYIAFYPQHVRFVS